MRHRERHRHGERHRHTLEPSLPSLLHPNPPLRRSDNNRHHPNPDPDPDPDPDRSLLLNTKNNEGRVPLHLAAWKASEDMVAFLVNELR